MEKLKYVSPEYAAQLEKLAETLCTPERFGAVAVAVAATVKQPELPFDMDDDSL